jgi:hypothetical protein
MKVRDELRGHKLIYSSCFQVAGVYKEDEEFDDRNYAADTTEYKDQRSTSQGINSNCGESIRDYPAMMNSIHSIIAYLYTVQSISYPQQHNNN